MGKIFLSYACADDEPFVKQLYQGLTENGIEVWWDRKFMERRGRTFMQELRDAIEDSDRLIAVIGPKAVTSDYARVEWEHALLFAKGVVPILRCGFTGDSNIRYCDISQYGKTIVAGEESGQVHILQFEGVE